MFHVLWLNTMQRHFGLQVSLGGRVRLMITGAAPVSPTVLTFLRAALGCQVKYHTYFTLHIVSSLLSRNNTTC